jgi:hypothetical protein
MSDTGDETAGRTERYLSLSPVVFKLLFYLGVVVWAGYLFLASREYTPADKQFPTIVLAVLFVTTGLKIVQLLLYHYGVLEQSSGGGMMSGIEDEGTDILPADQEKFEWIMSASIVLTAVAVYYLGFLYVLPVATLALTYYLTRNTVRSVLVTILFTVGFLLLFEVVLGTRIFEGIWFK